MFTGMEIWKTFKPVMTKDSRIFRVRMAVETECSLDIGKNGPESVYHIACPHTCFSAELMKSHQATVAVPWTLPLRRIWMPDLTAELLFLVCRSCYIYSWPRQTLF
jgi:hypothetical protein